MEAMTERWSDGRMDDLNAKVDRVDGDVRALRVEMRTEFGAVRSEMREGFDRIERRFEKVDERFEQVDERFEKVDKRFEGINARFERLDARLLAFHGVLVRTCVFAVGLLGVLVTVIGIQA
jgi:archaellum component FlaC